MSPATILANYHQEIINQLSRKIKKKPGSRPTPLPGGKPDYQ
jgi:hypothetical protein